MSEVRTTSATGGQKGVKPQRHDLLPKTALDVASEVYAFGAEKYADHNWRRKYEWSKSYAAAQRHLTTWWNGEDIDPESGLSHLGHAMFHLFAMATWEREDGSGVDNVYDDRWPHSLARADIETAAAEEERLLAEQADMDGWVDLGYIDEVQWRDAVLPTLAAREEAQATLDALINYALPIRFICGVTEVEDTQAEEPLFSRAFLNDWVNRPTL